VRSAQPKAPFEESPTPLPPSEAWEWGGWREMGTENKSAKEILVIKSKN